MNTNTIPRRPDAPLTEAERALARALAAALVSELRAESRKAAA